MSTVRSAAFDLAGVAQASLRRAANMLHLAGDAENARKFDEEAAHGGGVQRVVASEEASEGRRWNVKERPILFSAPMVRAILAGKKTQTRRIINLDGDAMSEAPPRFNCYVLDTAGFYEGYGFYSEDGTFKCPYGAPGDRLWVRETHFIESDGEGVVYRERGEFLDGWTKRGLKWRSPIFMPRWASRITLEVVAVRVERLQGITEHDATCEGFERSFEPDGSEYGAGLTTAVEAFEAMWHKINGPDSWSANPWVWVVEFKRFEKGGA